MASGCGSLLFNNVWERIISHKYLRGAPKEEVSQYLLVGKGSMISKILRKGVKLIKEGCFGYVIEDLRLSSGLMGFLLSCAGILIYRIFVNTSWRWVGLRWWILRLLTSVGMRR